MRFPFIPLLVATISHSTLVTAAAILLSNSNDLTICTSTLCVQGTTNTTLFATLLNPSTGNAATLLLPDTYTSASSLPPNLLSVLSSPLTSLTLSSSALTSSSSQPPLTFPLTITLSPGLSVYSKALFASQGTFTPVDNVNSTVPPPSSSFTLPGSVAIPSGFWAVVSPSANSTSTTTRLVFWSSIPDFSQLPASVAAASSSLEVVSVQSSACSPPCSSAGVCSAQGTCTCRPGFTGASCETCAKGFFGPNCSACPVSCTSCDDGIDGSGICLTPIVSNPPLSCNCANGECASSSSTATCTCNSGWTTLSTDQQQCSSCASGFFNNGSGDCTVCSANCLSCTTGGTCSQCATGFSPSTSDPTKCVPAVVANCPDGSFAEAGSCSPCSSECKTCTGPLSSECIVCGSGKIDFNGTCVAVTSSGVCTGTGSGTPLIANNAQGACDACPAKCTECEIPNFSIVSTVSQAQCTACLPGSVLSAGQCLDSCPAGTFIDPSTSSNVCAQCNPECGTCGGTKDFCLTCASTSQFAFNGTCVATCPSGTVKSGTSCLPCHSDCATCSGSSFTQCTSCHASRPVVSSGRCLMTCAINQFFDNNAGACTSCDASCGSCSGAGPSSCMTCSAGKILQAGTCVDATCTGGSGGFVNALGTCLSNLVQVSPSGTISTPPAVSNTALPTGGPTILAWWQILLIALVTFGLLALILCLWRRKARIQRMQKTKAFKEKRMGAVHWWSWPWHAFSSRKVGRDNNKDIRNSEQRARDAEEWKIELERVERGSDRGMPPPGPPKRREAEDSWLSSPPASPMLEVAGGMKRRHSTATTIKTEASSFDFRDRPSSRYSDMHGPTSRSNSVRSKRVPVPTYDPTDTSLFVSQPREPLKDSGSTARYNPGTIQMPNPGTLPQPHINESEPALTGAALGEYWLGLGLQQANTGSSSNTNPFRR